MLVFSIQVMMKNSICNIIFYNKKIIKLKDEVSESSMILI